MFISVFSFPSLFYILASFLLFFSILSHVYFPSFLTLSDPRSSYPIPFQVGRQAVDYCEESPLCLYHGGQSVALDSESFETASITLVDDDSSSGASGSNSGGGSSGSCGGGGGGSVGARSDGANSNGSNSGRSHSLSSHNGKKGKRGGGKSWDKLALLGVAIGGILSGAVTGADRLSALRKKRRTGTVLSVRTLRARVVWRLAQVSEWVSG